MTAELARLEAARATLSAAFEELNAAAIDYARAETLAYSKAHPRRKVTFCATMGTTTLHVQPGGTFSYRDDYQLGAYPESQHRRSVEAGAPEFLNLLADIESEFGIRYALGGDLNLDCKGGQIVRERTDW